MMNVLRFVMCMVALCAAMPVHGGTPGWRAIAPLAYAVANHSVVMVHTGDVLVIGGTDATGVARADVWVIRANTGQRIQALSGLSTARARCAVVSVRVGTETIVYVIGGYTGTQNSYSSSDVVDVIRYDAGQNNWRTSRSGSLPAAAGDVRAVFDGSSSVVTSGGYQQTSGAFGSGVPLAVTAAIDAATGAVRRLGDHVTARGSHGAYRFLDPLNAWRVLVAGGDIAATTTAELLAGNAWDGRANPPRALRNYMADVSDVSGTARAFGGENAGAPLATTEWYDPKSGWRVAPRMNEARSKMHVTHVAGPVDTAAAYLVVGGSGVAGPLSTTELFMMPSAAAAAGSFETSHNTLVAASYRGVAMSAVNLPFVIGGGPSANVEVLQPLSAADVTFPNTEVGARSDSVPIVITNTWLLPVRLLALRTVGDPDMLIAVDTVDIVLAPGARRTVLAWFRPTAAGQRTTSLVIDMGPIADTVLLRGVGLASTIQITTGIVDHGDVLRGATSRMCATIFRNNGTDTAVVDSIALPGGSDMQVESPRGRVRVAPGDSLVACFLFIPQQRGSRSSTAVVHVGSRTYPIAVVGRGIRTTGIIRVAIGCDTLHAAPADTTTFTITLENTADRPVVVTDVTVDAAITASAWLADASVLPLTINPGAAIPVDIRYAVQREGEERFVIRCASNSDSAMTNTACVIIRSRTLVASVGRISVGRLCLGDSAVRTYSYTNASAIDTIRVVAIDVENADGYALQAAPITIAPRTSVPISIVVHGSAAGVISGRVVIATLAGSSSLPIDGTVISQMRVTPIPVEAVAGDRISAILECQGITEVAAQFVLRIPPKMFSVRSVQSTAGSTPITAASVVRPFANGVVVDVQWTQLPPGGSASLVLDVDVLRGDESRARVLAERYTDSSVCIQADTALMRVDTGCGGERSGVRLSSRPAMSIMPMPASANMRVLVHSPGGLALRLECVTMQGAILSSTAIGSDVSYDVTLNCAEFARGVIGVRLVSDAGIHHVMPVILVP